MILPGQANVLMTGLFAELPSQGAHDPAYEFAFGVSWLGGAPGQLDERIILGYPKQGWDRLPTPETFRGFIGRYVERSRGNKTAKRKVTALGKSYTQGFPIASSAVTEYLAILREDGGNTKRWRGQVRDVIQWVFGITEPGVAFVGEADAEANKAALTAEIEAIRDVIGDTQTDKIIAWIAER